MIDGHADSEFLLPTTLESAGHAPDDPIQWTRYVVLDGDYVRGGVLAHGPARLGERPQRSCAEFSIAAVGRASSIPSTPLSPCRW